MFDIIDMNGDIIEDYSGRVYRYIKNDNVFYLVFDKSNFKLRAIALTVGFKETELIDILRNPCNYGFPSTLHEYFNLENDERVLSVTVYNPKGNSRGNSIAGKLFIPPLWIKMLGLEDDNKVNVVFDGKNITISKR